MTDFRTLQNILDQLDAEEDGEIELLPVFPQQSRPQFPAYLGSAAVDPPDGDSGTGQPGDSVATPPTLLGPSPPEATDSAMASLLGPSPPDAQDLAVSPTGYSAADGSPVDGITVTAQRSPSQPPTSAYGSGRDVVYVYPDGTSETRSAGTLAWRANNPGNLEYNSNTRDMGAMGAAVNNRAIFPDQESGLAAMNQLLDNPKYQGLSIDDLVKRYTGRSNEDLANYQSFVRNWVGLPGTTSRDSLTPQQWDDVKTGMRRFEKWTPGAVTFEKAGQ